MQRFIAWRRRANKLYVYIQRRYASVVVVFAAVLYRRSFFSVISIIFFFPIKPRAHSDSTSMYTCHYFYVLNRHHLGSSGVIDFHDRVLCAPRCVSVAKTLFIYVLPLSALVNPYRSGDVWPHFILRKSYHILANARWPYVYACGYVTSDADPTSRV